LIAPNRPTLLARSPGSIRVVYLSYAGPDDTDLAADARTTPAVPPTLKRKADDAASHHDFLPSVPPDHAAQLVDGAR
jgi:hypothetical protein